MLSFWSPLSPVGLISFNSLLPIHDLIFQFSFSFFKLRSSNNWSLKLSWTLVEAMTIMRWDEPVCFAYSRISSAIPIAEHVLPEPRPWYKRRLL